MNTNYFTFYYMLNILLKTLVCHYLHWIFFLAIFVLHLLIFNPFCTRFYCMCVCVRVCVFLFQLTSVWRSFVLHSVEPVPFCVVPFWQYASVSAFLSWILLSSLLSIILPFSSICYFITHLIYYSLICSFDLLFHP